MSNSQAQRRRTLVSFICFILTMTLSYSLASPLSHAESVTGIVAVGANPSGIAFDTSSNLIYVSDYGVNGTFPSVVSVINGSSNSVIATITVGVNPAAVGVDSLTHKAYVANYNSTNVSVISGTSNTTATITVGTHPSGVAVNPGTNRIYVPNNANGTVSVIDGTTSSVVSTISVGRSPVGIAVMTRTNKIYVTNSLDGTISVIDGQTNTVIRTIQAGNDPGSIATNNSTNLVYVVNSNSSSGVVTVIDGSTDNVAYTIPVGAYPAGISLNQQTNKIYVANSADGTVSVVDGFTRTEVNTVSLAFGAFPGAVGVNPVTNEIYVVNGGGRRTLSIISGNPTSTTLNCNPSAVPLNSTTVCIATVVDNSGTGATTPTGVIYFFTTGAGSFNSTSCTLKGVGTNASCSVSYTPIAIVTGAHAIHSTYAGDSKHMTSSGSKTLTVTSSSVGGTLISGYRLSVTTTIVVQLGLMLSTVGVVVLLVRRIQSHVKIIGIYGDKMGKLSSQATRDSHATS